jgi:hypothetical protein
MLLLAHHLQDRIVALSSLQIFFAESLITMTCNKKSSENNVEGSADNRNCCWEDFCCRHLLGFLLFLGLTIFTVSKLPRYVEPCIEQLLRMRTGIIASLPSFLHLPYWLDSSSFSGTGSSENCPVSLFVQVPKPA